MPTHDTKAISGEPWLDLTYRIIGLAMEVHNEIGPGHREAAYHNALAVMLASAGLQFEIEPFIPVVLADGTTVAGNCPDFTVGQQVIVELKAQTHTISRDQQAQIIGYFAALPGYPVALYLNFGRPRLEYRRLLPPKSIQSYQRAKWGKPL